MNQLNALSNRVEYYDRTDRISGNRHPCRWTSAASGAQRDCPTGKSGQSV